jgi:hypothetical protein
VQKGVKAMHVRDILIQRQTELKASISAVEAELKDIDLALKAMGASKPESDKPVSMAARFQVRHSMPVNDAVIRAVEAGRKTPVLILDYIQKELGIQTTLNSVRSRVSPLKQEGKIGHDGTGWVPAQNRFNL